MKRLFFLLGGLMLLSISSCYNYDNIKSNSDIEIIWEKDHKKKFSDEIKKFSPPMLHQNMLYVFSENKVNGEDVLLKFNNLYVSFIAKWEKDFQGGFSSEPYIYDNQLFIIRRESDLIVIDLNTMTVSQKIEFGYISSIYKILGNKMYLSLPQTNSSQIIELDLDTKKHRVIYETQMQTQGFFAPASNKFHPYIADNGDTSILIIEKRFLEDSLKVINYNITNQELRYKIVSDNLSEDGVFFDRIYIFENRIYLGNSKIIECRDLNDGSLIWTKEGIFNSLLITPEKIFYSDDKLNCMNTKSRTNIWTKSDLDYDYYFGGWFDLTLYGNILFLNRMPANANTGELIESWQMRDNYNNNSYPYVGNPVLDENSGNLYVTSEYKIMFLKMPEI